MKPSGYSLIAAVCQAFLSTLSDPGACLGLAGASANTVRGKKIRLRQLTSGVLEFVQSY